MQQGVNPGFNGDVCNVSFQLSDQIMSLIKAIPFALNQDSENSLTWAFSKDGFFFSQICISFSKGFQSFEPRFFFHVMDLEG